MAKEILLQLKNISVKYGGVKALNGVNISLREGEIIALMGPNGAGKSTILKVILGLAPAYSGKVLWHKKEIKPVPHEVVQRGISFVPQGRRIFSRLTVQENLQVAGFTVKNKDEIKRCTEEIIELFPTLKQKNKEKAGKLSGGQQQMLALARGLMTDPKVLLLDEPSLGLSPKVIREVFAKIKEINERHQTAVIVVEHNIKSLLNLADRGYILRKGQVVLENNSQELQQSDVLWNTLIGKK